MRLRDAILVAVGALLIFGVARLFIVTDKQRIERLLDQGVVAFNSADVAGTVAIVDDSCTLLKHGGKMSAATRSQVEEVVQGVFGEFSMIEVEQKKRQVVVTDDQARVNFRLVVKLQPRGVNVKAQYHMRGVMALKKKSPEVWRVTRVELIEARGASL